MLDARASYAFCKNFQYFLQELPMLYIGASFAFASAVYLVYNKCKRNGGKVAVEDPISLSSNATAY